MANFHVLTGIFGVPKQLAADAAYDALIAFDQRLQKSDTARHLREIHFINIDAETTEVFINTFKARRATAPVHRDDSVVTYSRQQPGRPKTVSGGDSVMPGSYQSPGDAWRPGDDAAAEPWVSATNRRSQSAPLKADRRHPSSIAGDGASSAAAGGPQAILGNGSIMPGAHHSRDDAWRAGDDSANDAPVGATKRRSMSVPRRGHSRRSTIIADNGASLAAAAGAVDDCVICMCPLTNPKQLSCGHKFCTGCIEAAFDKCQPKCPSCGKLFGVMKGNQPEGTMNMRTVGMNLAGYEAYTTIVIDYDIPDGIQDVSVYHFLC
jgi:Deltex C-terminal domain/Zinc finger, C3HC4 type (RING finger)